MLHFYYWFYPFLYTFFWYFLVLYFFGVCCFIYFFGWCCDRWCHNTILCFVYFWFLFWFFFRKPRSRCLKVQLELEHLSWNRQYRTCCLRFPCSLCGVVFWTPECLNQHVLLALLKQDGPLRHSVSSLRVVALDWCFLQTCVLLASWLLKSLLQELQEPIACFLPLCILVHGCSLVVCSMCCSSWTNLQPSLFKKTHDGPLKHFSVLLLCLDLMAGLLSPLQFFMCFFRPALLTSSLLHLSHINGSETSEHSLACLYTSSCVSNVTLHFWQSTSCLSSMCFSSSSLVLNTLEQALQVCPSSESSISITTPFALIGPHGFVVCDCASSKRWKVFLQISQ